MEDEFNQNWMYRALTAGRNHQENERYPIKNTSTPLKPKGQPNRREQRTKYQLKDDKGPRKDVFDSGSLHHAVGSRDIDVELVKRIVTDDPESARHCNQFGRLPLHYALDRTTINSDVILLLLRVYPDGANVEDHDHQTPYDLSLKWGHSRRIHRALLEACPSQDWQYLLQLRWGLLAPVVQLIEKFLFPSPLPQAVITPEPQSQPQPRDHSEDDELNPINEYQLSSASHDSADMSPPPSPIILPSAATSGKDSTQTDIGRLKTIEEVEQERTKDVFDSGSLHHAVGSRDIDFDRVKRIVTHDPASARHCNQFGRLPLHYALDRTTINSDVILLLLRVYPDGANVEDHDYQTPYDLSLKWGHSRRIHRALLEACPSQDWQYLLQLRWGLLTPLVRCLFHPSPPPQSVLTPEPPPSPPQSQQLPQLSIDDHRRPSVVLQSPLATGDSEDRPHTFIDIDTPPHDDAPPMQESTDTFSDSASHHFTTRPINVVVVNHNVVRVVNATVIHHHNHIDIDSNDNHNHDNNIMDDSRPKPKLSLQIPESPKRKRRRSFVFDSIDD